MNAQQQTRMISGAAIYAKSERSDPFAYNRAMTHSLNGVASIDGKDENFYQAESYAETRRHPDIGEYVVTAYKNAKRP